MIDVSNDTEITNMLVLHLRLKLPDKSEKKIERLKKRANFTLYRVGMRIFTLEKPNWMMKGCPKLPRATVDGIVVVLVA